MNVIPTYKFGCHFRSRLEARWAVFFNELGIAWEYEKEGFYSDAYPPREYYLPDFYLSETKTWVEVKGDANALCRESERMTKLLDFGGVLPDFADSYKSDGRGLLLLGSIPEGRDGYCYLHPIIQHHEGLIKNWCYFDCVGTLDFDLPRICYSDRDVLYPRCGLEAESESWAIETKEFVYLEDYYTSKSNRGYRAARSARFEHGESGAT